VTSTYPLQKNHTLETETCKAIVFNIAGHVLALPVAAIFKVIRASIVFYTNLGDSRLIHMENQALPILDLHLFLSQIRPSYNNSYTQASSSSQEEFLVLVRSRSVSLGSRQENLSAIPVDEPPILMDLPLSNAYMLPLSHRKKMGDIATHVVVIPYQGANITIMLLDLQQALAASGFDRSSGSIF
jgi:hypothetical protein